MHQIQLLTRRLFQMGLLRRQFIIITIARLHLSISIQDISKLNWRITKHLTVFQDNIKEITTTLYLKICSLIIIKYQYKLKTLIILVKAIKLTIKWLVPIHKGQVPVSNSIFLLRIRHLEDIYILKRIQHISINKMHTLTLIHHHPKRVQDIKTIRKIIINTLKIIKLQYQVVNNLIRAYLIQKTTSKYWINKIVMHSLIKVQEPNSLTKQTFRLKEQLTLINKAKQALKIYLEFVEDLQYILVVDSRQVIKDDWFKLEINENKLSKY